MIHDKVYIVDYDLISPLGVGKENVLKSLKNNYKGEAGITRFKTDGLPLKIGCELAWELDSYYKTEDKRIQKAVFFDRKLELTVVAKNKMGDRLMDIAELCSPDRAGVIMGIGSDVLSFELMEDDALKYFKYSEEPFTDIAKLYNNTKGYFNTVVNPYDVSSMYLAYKLNLGAFQKSVLTACAASTQAVMLGCESIKRGEADIVIAGGTDSIINVLAFLAFYKLGVLAAESVPPGRSCRPFDITRSGTIAGEAAGLCILAGENFVSKNGIQPKFEVMGYGNTLDAYKITSPDPSGRGMTRAVTDALESSGLAPNEIDYINLHGTGTYLNDPVEINSLKSIFGDFMARLPVSSTKDRHGHAIAAAGIQEMAILCICMENDLVPSNMNLEKPIVDNGYDIVQQSNRNAQINVGMTNNFSFGGVNTSLIIKKI